MPKKSTPDLSLFLDIVQKLEAIGIPYVIIGGFAATIYGITRATYDIDIIVDLTEEHMLALSDAGNARRETISKRSSRRWY